MHLSGIKDLAALCYNDYGPERADMKSKKSSHISFLRMFIPVLLMALPGMAAVMPVSYDFGTDPGKTTYEDAGFSSDSEAALGITDQANSVRFDRDGSVENHQIRTGVITQTFDGLGNGARNNFTITAEFQLNSPVHGRGRPGSIILFGNSSNMTDLNSGGLMVNILRAQIGTSVGDQEITVSNGLAPADGTELVNLLWSTNTTEKALLDAGDILQWVVDVSFSGADDMLVDATLTRLNDAVGNIGDSQSVSFSTSSASTYIGGTYFGFGGRYRTNMQTHLDTFGVQIKPQIQVLFDDQLVGMNTTNSLPATSLDVPISRTYVVTNLSGFVVSLTNSTAAVVFEETGTEEYGGFSITSNITGTSTNLAPGETAPFTVQFSTNVAVEEASATVKILSSDPLFNPYTFTIKAQAVETASGPAVSTNTGVTVHSATSATLRGELTAGGLADAYIVWGTATGNTDNTNGWQHVVPFPATQQDEEFETTLSGLYYGQQYYYMVYATNEFDGGASDASEVVGPFTTSMPIASTVSATAAATITATTADLQGTLNAPDSIFTVTAYWSTNSLDATTWADGNDGSFEIGYFTNVTAHPLSVPVTDLLEATEYFYTFRASNPATNLWAENASFTTAAMEPPVVGVGAGAIPAVGEVTLEGVISTFNGILSDVRIYFGTSDKEDVAGNWDTNFVFAVGDITEGVAFSTNVTDLLYDGVQYYYRVYAQNEHDEAWSATVGPFTTLMPIDAAVSATAATNITATTADLQGTLNAPDSIFTVTAYWSTNDYADGEAWLAGVDASEAASEAAGTFTNVTAHPLSVPVTDLLEATEYFYTFRASNAATNLWAENASFSLWVDTVVWSDLDTTNITYTEAWATATVNTNLTEAVLVWDETDQGMGSTNAWPNRLSLGSQDAGEVTGQMTDLSEGTPYVWRLYGESAETNGWSGAVAFDTLARPASGTGGDTSYVTNDVEGVFWKVHAFTTVGTNTFTVSSAGEVEVLVVGGGGAGGTNLGGGGGAGGFLEGSTNLSAGGFTVVVGAGGQAPTSAGPGGDGSLSQFGDDIIAFGGGGGGSISIDTAGRPGASGGGGGNPGGAAGIGSQGFNGGVGGSGTGNSAPNSRFAAGGGGAGGAGADGDSGTSNGGLGLSSGITGATFWYAGGGGGGRDNGETLGHSGGGDGGSQQSSPGMNGGDALVNSGSGGGGGTRNSGIGGDGGSGIVILRYEGTDILLFDGVNPAGSHSFYTDYGTTYQVHQFQDIGESTFTVIPEPGTLALLGIFGLAMIISLRRKRA